MTRATRPAAAPVGHSIIKAIADNASGGSVATRMRRARFDFFMSLLSRVDGHKEILDIGGTQEFWNLMLGDERHDLRVTLLNIEHQPVASERFVSARGDARSMPELGNNSFDVVFSNSVIEHVGTYDDQKHMAGEVMRVGKRWFVQTPNKRFPLEPHFLFPWFQYLPSWMRAQMVHRMDVGWYRRIPDYAAAKAEVDSIQLLTRGKFEALFPGSKVWVERLGPLAKSFVAYGGWD